MRQFFLALILLFFCGKVCDAAIVLRMDPVESKMMGAYIADFCLKGHRLFNGKILQVAMQNPA